MCYNLLTDTGASVIIQFFTYSLGELEPKTKNCVPLIGKIVVVKVSIIGNS